jgi:hypothetical protein
MFTILPTLSESNCKGNRIIVNIDLRQKPDFLEEVGFLASFTSLRF